MGVTCLGPMLWHYQHRPLVMDVRCILSCCFGPDNAVLCRCRQAGSGLAQGSVSQVMYWFTECGGGAIGVRFVMETGQAGDIWAGFGRIAM